MSRGSADLVGTAAGIVEIGPQWARQLVDLRPFDVLADLERVNGIGPATVQAITEEGLACAS